MSIRNIVKGLCEKTKCFFDVYTVNYIDNNLYKKEEIDKMLGTISSHNYSRGTSTPSGGSDGDIYDQYF